MNSQPFDYSRLSSYFRELAETSEPAVPSSALPDELRRACGPWVSITAAVAKASLALAGVKTAGSAVDLVVALSGAGDAQTELLKSIKADTQLLRQEPLQTAITLMGEAERVGPSDERWVRFLERAIDSLYRAKSLAASSEEQAVVYFGLACAYVASDKSMDARYWIEESVKSEREILDAFLQNQMFITDVRSVTWSYNREEFPRSLWMRVFADTAFASNEVIIEAPNHLLDWATIGRATGKTKRTEKFGRFLPFANSVEISAATISGRPEVEVLDLDPSFVWKTSNYKVVSKNHHLACSQITGYLKAGTAVAGLIFNEQLSVELREHYKLSVPLLAWRAVISTSPSFR